MTQHQLNTTFLPIEGPDRCQTCYWHVQTQGHHPNCPGGEIRSRKPIHPPGIPRGSLLPWASTEQIKQADLLRAFRQPVKTPAAHQRKIGEPWFEATFRGVIEDIRTVKSGRNSRLYWAARRLGELSHYEHWDETDSVTALMDASAHWDTTASWRRQSRATIQSGWDAGVANPKEVSND